MRWVTAFLLLGLLLSPHKARGQMTYQGVVIFVVDGDTLDVQAGTSVRRVRLDKIDAPETKKPRAKCDREVALGLRAKQILIEGVLSRNVEVRVRKLERWGRDLASVILNGTVDVGAALVRGGYAVEWNGRYETKHNWCKS